MSYFPEDIPFMSKKKLRKNGIRIPKDATDKNVGTTDARQDFMDIVYSELHSDGDNNRANRIIEAADEYAESAPLGTNLAEVGTDTISRQAAIDVLDAYQVKIENGEENPYAWARLRMSELPSAQPEPCEDAVSREEVLNCLEWQYPDKLPRTKIMELPPVTPKQRTGHWYPVGMVEAVGGESAMWGSAIAYHKCSECDEQALQDNFEQEFLSDFCPHCGAKMKGVSE